MCLCHVTNLFIISSQVLLWSPMAFKSLQFCVTFLMASRSIHHHDCSSSHVHIVLNFNWSSHQIPCAHPFHVCYGLRYITPTAYVIFQFIWCSVPPSCLSNNQRSSILFVHWIRIAKTSHSFISLLKSNFDHFSFSKICFRPFLTFPDINQGIPLCEL